MITIGLDIGHNLGSEDNRGYLSNSLYKNEGDGNRALANKLIAKLKAYGFNVVTVGGTADGTQDLEQRAIILSRNNPDMVLSLHSNAGGGRGVEIYPAIEDLGKMYPFWEKMVAKISDATGLRNRGVIQEKLNYDYNDDGELNDSAYRILRLVKKYCECPVSMVEHAFHDNANDLEIYESKMDLIAQIEADLIAEYFGISKSVVSLGASDENTVKKGKEYKSMLNIGRYKGMEMLEVAGDKVILRVPLEVKETRATKANGARIKTGEMIATDKEISLRRKTTWDVPGFLDVPANTPLKVIEEADREGWLKVSFGDNEAGFVDAGFIKFR